MTYELVYTDRAKRDLNAAADYIAQHAPDTAERWFNGFVAALSSLRTQATTFGIAPESDRCSVEVRHFIYRTKSGRANRALYCIQKSKVYIVAIRRPGQDLLTEDELKQAVEQID